MLREIKARSPETECILLTGHATQNSAIEAIQLGAFGYFQKPFDIEQVLLSVQRAVEKHTAKQALRESEERFHALIQNAADLIVVIDERGVISYASPSSERIMGYLPQESIGRNFLEWVHPDDMHIALSSLASRSRIPGTAHETIVVRSLHKNGTWRLIEVLGTNLLADTAVRGIVMNMRDVTERKQAEDQVRRSEERFRALIEHSADAIALLDAGGVMIYESPAAKRIMKFQSDDRVGANIFDLLDTDNLQSQKELFEKVLKQPNLPFDTVFRYSHSDGSFSWAEATLTNLLDEPTVNAIVVNYRDITERKLADEALRKNEERYRLLFDNSPVGIFSATPLGQVVEINPIALQVLGSPSVEATKSINLLTFPLLVKTGFAANFQSCLDSGQSVFAEQAYTSKWGKSIYAQYRLTPIRDLNGNIVLIQVILEDITERKLAEDKILKLAFMLDTASNSITVHDFDGNCLMVNQRTLDMHGYTRDEFMSLSLSQLDVLESAGLISSRIQELLERGEGVFEVSHYRKDGSIIPLEVSARVSSWGDRPAILSVATDITERKQAEAALYESEEKYRLLVDQSPYAISIYQDGQIVFVNSAALSLMGAQSAGELIGKPTSSIVHPDSLETARTRIQRMIAGETGLYPVEDRYMRLDGSVVPVEVSAAPFTFKGRPAIQIIAIDITSRKEAEETTRRQSEQLQMLYEASQRLNRTLNLQEIYQAVCDFMANIAINNGLIISSFDHETQMITCRAFWMENKWLDVGSFPPIPLEEEGRGTQSVVIRTGQSMLVNDFQALVKTARTSYYVNDETNEIETEDPPEDEDVTRSALIVPLKTGGRVNGVIQVLSYRLNAYNENQLKLLESLSLHIASAEQNALLYAQVQNELHERNQAAGAINQRVAELGLLYESGLAFGKLLNPKEIAQKIINLLEQKMDWHHTAIRLYDMDTQTLQLLAFNQPDLRSVEDVLAVEEQLKRKVARLDQGLSGWVIRHKQTVRSNELKSDPRYIETLSGMQSGLYVPIVLGDRVLGAISIESENADAFSEADERLTNTLANQAASAFENARLFDETQRNIMELTSLHRTGQTLLAARLNLEQIYAAVHKAVAQTMPCEAFVIVLDDEEYGDYHAVYFFDKDEHFTPRRLPRGAGLSGLVIGSGETLLIHDTAETPVQATHFGSMESTRSILAVPLRRGDEIIGMLSTQSYQPHVFSESQRVLLETITGQLSSALDNARLYTETQARIKELETLHVISTSLRTIVSIEDALSTLLDNTLSTLETDAGAILLYDPSSNELRDVVTRGWFIEISEIPIKAGEGVAGTVFSTGESYYSPDFSGDALPHPFTRERVPAGWGGICLPIRTSTEIIGVLFVSVKLPRQINSQQIRLLESLVDMAGAALHRMRLHNETARRAEEFAYLYEMSKTLSAEYDLDSLLAVIVNRTREMLNASTSGMYLYHTESQELELMMDTSATVPIGSRLKLGEGVAGRVAQTRQPLRVDDYSIWEGRSPHYENISVRAVVEAPMLYAGELIGVLTADEIGDSNRKFTEADERLLSLFASQAAGAINSARHHEDTIRHAAELEQRVIERTTEIESTRRRLDLAASAGGIGVWEVNLRDLSCYWDARMHLLHGTHPSNFDNSLDTWWQLIHPQDRQLAQRQFEIAIQQSGLFTDEHRVILSDGSIRFVAAKAIVLYDAEHQPERMVGVNMDITERKRAEEIMHQANFEMERALRTKDEFLANMSHELRTPLNAILGISESLEEQFVGALNEKQLKYTGIIRESGRHLLELINDILDISKIEAGRMELEFQNLSVEKICQSSLRMVKELAQKKNLNVSFDVKGDVKTLLGDERRLKQALVNLLGNAVKFTPQGGAIGLDVCGFADLNEITFTVWDNGVGIAEDDIQYLFKPFVQLDSGLAREYQGTGLGLALVAQMIRLHGGHVHVESVLGQGSRFIITLPWMQEQQIAQAKLTAELPRLGLKPARMHTGKILLVEDTDVVITLMSEYLLYKGYKVFVARNGLEGVMLARKEHPDLILMDVMMPEMDGLEATRQIRKDRSLQNVPIIALTALAMAGDREFCLAAGMNDYMSKPIKMQELADMIEKHLGDGDHLPNVK